MTNLENSFVWQIYGSVTRLRQAYGAAGSAFASLISVYGVTGTEEFYSEESRSCGYKFFLEGQPGLS